MRLDAKGKEISTTKGRRPTFKERVGMLKELDELKTLEASIHYKIWELQEINKKNYWSFKDWQTVNNFSKRIYGVILKWRYNK